jgi:hypothetical protein
MISLHFALFRVHYVTVFAVHYVTLLNPVCCTLFHFLLTLLSTNFHFFLCHVESLLTVMPPCTYCM